MLPRLQAEERLKAITDGSISAGAMEVGDQREVMEALRDQAQIERAPIQKASAGVLASMGIAVCMPPEKAQSDG